MTIHYQNYKRFSAGQGYAGVKCRGLGAQVSSERWHAVDCQACRDTIIDVEVISRQGRSGRVRHATWRAVTIKSGDDEIDIPWSAFDTDWAPVEVALKAVFGDE